MWGYMRHERKFRIQIEDISGRLQDHAKLRNFSGHTCGVSPFEDANRQSLKS